MPFIKAAPRLRKINFSPGKEFIIVSSIIVLVIILEWTVDLDDIIINLCYRHKQTLAEEIAANAVIVSLLLSVHHILRIRNYKKLIRKQTITETNLQSYQQRFEMILSNSATILYTAPPDGKSGTDYISPNVRNILGYEPDDFKQSFFWHQIIHPEDAATVFTTMHKFFKEGFFENEFRVRHKNGSWCWIYNKMIMVYDEKGNQKEMVGTWLDITERKHAQEAIRKSEQRFQWAAKATKDVVYDWDMQKNEAWANDQHFVAFGYPTVSSNIVTADWWKSKLHPDEQDRVIDSIREATRLKKDTWSSEYRFRRADGTYAFILDRCIISYLENGLPSNCIGTMTDISALKNAEWEMILAKEKAEESAKAKSDFLANMSHEIRTPLNGIIGMTDMTLETDLTAEQKYYLGIVKSSSDTLLGLINDILDFSKIEAGRMEFAATSFSLRDEFSRSLQALGLNAAEKDIEFICQVDANVPDKLIGDVLRLQQVVTNLAGNAIKFTEKGEVIIKVQSQSVSKDDAVLHFTVSDTGIGIPEDKLPMIFDKFTQADASTSRKYGGTGLGLAITKRLVELMGGTIWAESKELYGSSFHFTVKFKLDPARTSSPSISSAVLENKRVLIVEDNRSTCEYLTEMLRHHKMKTVGVSNGKDAMIELTRAARLRQPYHLVILDITLPGQINGFDVAQTIKQDEMFKETEIIIVTMSQKVSDRQQFAGIGVTEFFSKPFNQTDLLNSIQNIVSGKTVLFDEEFELAHIRPVGTRPDAALKNTVKILLAEDNKVNQEVALSMLTKHGYNVSVANNGEEAVKAIQKEHFDLVLMDVQMPAMNGYEATQKIRQMQEPDLPHIPIIGLTANALNGDRQKCLDAGMDDYISKPINMKNLLTTITNLHKNRRAIPKEDPAPELVRLKVGFEELLQKLSASKDVVANCLDLFNEEIPPLLTKLDHAVQCRNTEEIKSICHGLRSSLLTMEMYAATRLAGRIEMLAGQNSPEEINHLLPALKREINEAVDYISKCL